MEGEVAPADPLDVDSKKISDTLNAGSAQTQSNSGSYGTIPNGTTANDGIINLHTPNKVSV